METNEDFFYLWQKKIKRIKTQEDFFALSKEAFLFQYTNNKIYQQWCNLLDCKVENINSLDDIPFLPIEFFKKQEITCFASTTPEDFFLSSATGSMQRSKHLVYDKRYYIENTFDCFAQFFSDVERYAFICLLPNYLEQEHSSLICMMEAFVKKSLYKQSGFYAHNLQEVVKVLQYNERLRIPTILFGVTYALLDLAENYELNLKNTLVFETGGMKGRRKEMPKQLVHKILEQNLGVNNIFSEYGMCELFSQSYSKGKGIFFCPRQMKVQIIEINDYKNTLHAGGKGIINIIDLANISSCCFIRTQDMGMQYDNGGFSILGRVDYSDIRGCNLMYQ